MSRTDSALEIIRKAQKEGKLTIGYKSTLEALKKKELEYAFTAVNAPQNIVEDIQYYSNLSETNYSPLNANSEELGVACRKQFTVAVVGVLKEKKE